MGTVPVPETAAPGLSPESEWPIWLERAGTDHPPGLAVEKAGPDAPRGLERAESEARQLGYGHLDLYTHERMTENVALYARIGYTEVDRRTERGFPRVYMRKRL